MKDIFAGDSILGGTFYIPVIYNINNRHISDHSILGKLNLREVLLDLPLLPESELSESQFPYLCIISMVGKNCLQDA